MDRRHGFKHQRIAILSLVLACALGSAQAGDYSNIYFFGNSISDSGTFINLTNLAPAPPPNFHASVARHP